MDVYTGIPYSNICPVLVRSTANGAVSVVVNGVPFTETANTAVNDGLVLINVTGLSGGTRYPAAVTTPNESDTITLRPFPTYGKVSMGVASCGQITNKPAYNQFIERDVDCVVNVGDEFYPEFAISAHGVSTIDTTSSLANASNVQNYYDKNLLARRTPELKQVLKTRGYARIPDDHDMGVNDCYWTLAQFQTAITGVVDTADMQSIIDASSKAMVDYNQINPPNTDANVDTNAFYTRFDLGEHAEVFMLSCICMGYDPTATDRLIRPQIGDMISSLHEAWLLARLAVSTKKIKIILSPKMTYNAEFINPDGWDGEAGWRTQRDRIVQAIHDQSPSWNIPGGVMFVSGDYHTPSVHAAYNGVDGSTFDHVNVTCCPAGSTTTNSGANGSYTRKKFDDFSGTQGASTHPNAPLLKNVGIITVPADGSYVEAEIVLSNGSTWWKGRVLAGENKLTYPDFEFG